MQPASPPITSIPARSRRQAMDWSLVLLSQGIEAIIEEAPESHGWQLLVTASDHDRALASLHLYRKENQRRFWRQPLPGSGLLFDWACLTWIVLLAAVYVLSAMRLPMLYNVGALDGSAVLQGEWWRLFTAVLLHADLPHLLANLTTGFVLLGLAMGSLGPGHALLAAYLSGALANLATLVLDPGHRNVGASGMIMAALGLLTAQSLSLWRTGFNLSKAMLRAVLGGVLLLILLGFSPGSDVIAHVAGFLFGGLFGAGLAALPEKRLQQPLTNRIAEVLCAGLVGTTWWLAIR